MAEVIGMPKLSDTMEEGAIAKWLVKEGDKIDEGGALCEIETDKATMEYQSPEAGFILKIIALPGKTIALDAPIAVVGKKDEKVDLAALIGASAPAKAVAPAPAAEAAVAKTSATAALKPVPAVATPVPALAPAINNGGRMRSSPLARKMAATKGLDLSRVQGSGPGGRIIARDLEGAAAGGAKSGSVAMPAVMRRGEDVTVPVTMMRKTIAKRLLAGKNDAPHFYLTISADMERMISWRAILNKQAGEGGTKVSVNDLVILAVSRALLQHPGVNASWQGESIIQYGNVHVAMAVALPTGLVTPVVRYADQLSIKQIAKTSRELAVKAKAGQLQNEDYTGGTFTISNLGMFGIEDFTAIINPPQAAILAVGATIPTPAVDANQNIVVQQRMKMTLSCDHRVIDGVMGAQFLQTLVQFLEEPLMMLD